MAQNTFICLAIRGKPEEASNRFAHFPGVTWQMDEQPVNQMFYIKFINVCCSKETRGKQIHLGNYKNFKDIHCFSRLSKR